MKKLLLSLVAGAALATSAHADVDSAPALLSFSGGNGSPLSISLLNTLQFDVLSNPTSGNYYFVFEDVLAGIDQDNLIDSTITYDRNGTGYTIDRIGGNFNFGTVDNDDMLLSSSMMILTSLAEDDSITLSAGSTVTCAGFAGVTPASGAYNVRLVDGMFQWVPANITAVPEPSTYALLAGAAVLAGVIVRRRRKTA